MIFFAIKLLFYATKQFFEQNFSLNQFIFNHTCYASSKSLLQSYHDYEDRLEHLGQGFLYPNPFFRIFFGLSIQLLCHNHISCMFLLPSPQFSRRSLLQNKRVRFHIYNCQPENNKAQSHFDWSMLLMLLKLLPTLL